ncbi:MAG: hypothetical protein AAFR41_12940 [Pseudomonadota bacterium]
MAVAPATLLGRFKGFQGFLENWHFRLIGQVPEVFRHKIDCEERVMLAIGDLGANDFGGWACDRDISQKSHRLGRR